MLRKINFSDEPKRAQGRETLCATEMKPDKKDKIIADLIVMIIITVIYLFWTPTPTQTSYDSFCGNAGVAEQNEETFRGKYGNAFNFETGEKLFKQNCAVCHSLGRNSLTGPGLSGVSNRVPSEDWLFHYISNPDSLIKLKDPYTLKLQRDFPSEDGDPHKYVKLTDKEVKDIIAYCTLPISIY